MGWNIQVLDIPMLSCHIMTDMSFWLLRCCLPCLQKTLLGPRLLYYQICFVNHFSSKREWRELLTALSLTGVLMLVSNSQILMQPQILRVTGNDVWLLLNVLRWNEEKKRLLRRAPSRWLVVYLFIYFFNLIAFEYICGLIICIDIFGIYALFKKK